MSMLFLATALFAFTGKSEASIVITNTQPCAYMCFLALAPTGTCATAAIVPTAIPIVVPPFSVTPFACPPGVALVGVCVQETAPFPMAACTGVAGPPCVGFPLVVPGFGSCGATVTFTPGLPAALTI